MNLSGYFLSAGNDVNDQKNWITFKADGNLKFQSCFKAFHLQGLMSRALRTLRYDSPPLSLPLVYSGQAVF